MDKSHWIFIAPHFDDVALSCGGLVWDLSNQGHGVEVWTIMAGYPPDEDYSEFAQQNHRAWGLSGEAAIRMRMGEDRAVCDILGAQPRHFDWPDVIYRRDQHTGLALVNNNEELFSKQPEDQLVEEVAHMLMDEIPQNTQLVLPIGLGHHVDHRAVRMAGDKLGWEGFYYADYPYILKNFDEPIFLDGCLSKLRYPLNQDALHAWQNAALCYTSQLSGFWRDEAEVRLALRNYMAGGGGRLWQKNPS